MSEQDLPHLQPGSVKVPRAEELEVASLSTHAPRILLLNGSLRKRSFSRLVVEECARLLQHFGCETRIYDPSGLPLPDEDNETHPKVLE